MRGAAAHWLHGQPLSQLDLPHPTLQGTVVSFDPAHDPSNPAATAIPRLDITQLSYSWGGAEAHAVDTLAGAAMWPAPLEFRPAVAYEGAADTRAPRFSSCSVPLVMWCALKGHRGRGATSGRRLRCGLAMHRTITAQAMLAVAPAHAVPPPPAAGPSSQHTTMESSSCMSCRCCGPCSATAR